MTNFYNVDAFLKLTISSCLVCLNHCQSNNFNLPKSLNLQRPELVYRIKRVVSKKFFVASIGVNPKVDANLMPRQKITSIF